MAKKLLIYDTFNDVDGVLLENHKMNIGPGWIKKAGEAKVQSNKGVASAPDAIYVSDAGISKGKIEMALDIAADDGQTNLYGGHDENAHGYIAVMSPHTDVIQLYEYAPGVAPQMLAEKTGAGLTPGDHVLKMTLDGSNMIVYIDGIIVVHGPASVAYGTRWGFELYKASDVAQSMISSIQVTK